MLSCPLRKRALYSIEQCERDTQDVAEYGDDMLAQFQAPLSILAWGSAGNWWGRNVVWGCFLCTRSHLFVVVG